MRKMLELRLLLRLTVGLFDSFTMVLVFARVRRVDCLRFWRARKLPLVSYNLPEFVSMQNGDSLNIIVIIILWREGVKRDDEIVWSCSADFLDELWEVFLVEDYDVCHEIVVVDLDLQLLCYLVESVTDGVLALHHHSDTQADLAFKVDPVGDEGTGRFGLLSFLKHSH